MLLPCREPSGRSEGKGDCRDWAVGRWKVRDSTICTGCRRIGHPRSHESETESEVVAARKMLLRPASAGLVHDGFRRSFLGTLYLRWRRVRFSYSAVDLQNLAGGIYYTTVYSHCSVGISYDWRWPGRVKPARHLIILRSSPPGAVQPHSHQTVSGR